MRVFCLGGAGRICREAVFDLAEYSNFEEIAVGDINEGEARLVAEEAGDPRVHAVRADIRDVDGTARLLRDYDVVVDGTQISIVIFAHHSTINPSRLPSASSACPSCG
jgi:saccharopine dehydrogenase-like NADP-dependent oxidoreductase